MPIGAETTKTMHKSFRCIIIHINCLVTLGGTQTGENLTM